MNSLITISSDVSLDVSGVLVVVSTGLAVSGAFVVVSTGFVVSGAFVVVSTGFVVSTCPGLFKSSGASGFSIIDAVGISNEIVYWLLSSLTSF